MAEDVAAADLTLTDEDLRRIGEILPAGGFGARYGKGSLPVRQQPRGAAGTIAASRSLSRA